MNKLGQGEVVDVEVKRPRRIKFHRLFWGLMQLVWQNLTDHDTYPTVESLVTEMKILTGHYDRQDIAFDGKRYPVLTPKSIRFAAMDDTEFSAFFARCADLIAERWLPGITNDELRAEVETMIGVRT